MYGARDGCRPHIPSVEDWYTICYTTQAYVRVGVSSKDH